MTMPKFTFSLPEELIAEAEALVTAGRARSVSASVPPDPAMESARYVVRLLIDKQMTHFTCRELHRRVHRRLPTATEVAAVIDTLTQLGWVRPNPTGGYELHPEAANAS